jgi:uncharacterized protein (TIGR03435 family)
MIPTYLMPLANHLWQSTLFAVLVALLCALLRKHEASLRYWLWLAVSVKFLIPLSLLIDLCNRLQPASVPAGPTPITFMIKEASQPFALAAPAPMLAAVAGAPSIIPAVLFSVWLCGFAIGAVCWLRSWLRMRGALRSANSRGVDAGRRLGNIRILQSSLPVEPCVFGIFRPVLLLPDGIDAHLTREQLETIVLHELCHVRRHDNLTAAVHLLAETIFWFYPPIYWIGGRMMKEREIACDEGVMSVVPDSETYAQGILAVCRFALRAAPVLAAGVAGPDLQRRIEAIMARRACLRLDWPRKLFLTAALGIVIGAPFWAGVLFVRASDAQTSSPATKVTPFGVASIKPNRSGDLNSGFRRFVGGELNTTNITLKMLISFAYDLPQDRILQGPSWLDSEKYDILAKPDPDPGHAVDNSRLVVRLRTQALLADRFKLALHKDMRQLTIFKLLVDKDGPKHLDAAKGGAPDWVNNGRHVDCQALTMELFAKGFLTEQMRSPVIDETGIKGSFDFSMGWVPDEHSPGKPEGEPSPASGPSGPSFFTALREQLGLKLEAGKGPVEVLIVDHAERPSQN